MAQSGLFPSPLRCPLLPECVRGSGEDWPGKRPAKGTQTHVRKPKLESEQGPYFHSGNFPARHDRASLIGPFSAPFAA